MVECNCGTPFRDEVFDGKPITIHYEDCAIIQAELIGR